jgi:hypothetical protein
VPFAELKHGYSREIDYLWLRAAKRWRWSCVFRLWPGPDRSGRL